MSDVHTLSLPPTIEVEWPVIVLEFCSVQRALLLRELSFIIVASVNSATCRLTASSVKRAKPCPKVSQLQEMLDSK